VTLEGTDVAMNSTTGYPTGGADLAAAAGLTSADYQILTSRTDAANQPAVPAGSVVAIPNSVAGTPTGKTCFVIYTPGTTAAAPTPTITSTTSGDNC
jgi:hypothetical protein